MRDIDAAGSMSHAQPSGQSLQSCVGLGKRRVDAMSIDSWFITGSTHAVNIDIDKLSHKSCQLCNVYSRASIDLWWVLFRKDAGFHICHISGWPTCPLGN